MKKTVKQCMVTLGGHLTSEWQKDCSLLVMSKISVTIKVICALVSQKYIILPTYLEQYIKHLHGKAEKPDPGMFTPDLAETQLDATCVSFKPDVRRKTLFKGLKFYFCSEKQLKKMKFAIELAGGLPVLMKKGNIDPDICKQGSVVMSCADMGQSQSDDWVTQIHNILDKKNKHFILDAEIGYAILYCSTEKHCNPDYVADEDLCKLPSQSLSQVEPFVPNTETQKMTQSSSKQVDGKYKHDSSTVIDETKHDINTDRTQTPRPTQNKKIKDTAKESQIKDKVNSPLLPSQSTKKRRKKDEEEEEEEAVPKRIKQEPVTPSKSTMDSVTDDKTKQTVSPKKSGTRSNVETVFSDKAKQTVAKQPETKVSDNVEAVWDSDDDLDYSKIDTDITTASPQIRSTRSGRKISPSPEPKEKTKSKGQKGRSRSRSKSRSRSRSPVPSKVNIKTEPVASPSPTKTSKSKAKTSQIGEDSDENTSKRTGRRKQNVLEERSSENEEEVDRKPVLTTNSNNDCKTLPDGFLTTRLPIKGQVKKCKSYELAEDLPSRCVNVETVSLVVRTTPRVENEAGDCPEGFTRWKGRIVRNFKKFRKTQHEGSQGLPNIIGGTDLEVHTAKRSKELDDFFKESLQNEDRHNADDRKMQQLFDQSSNTRRGR
ncbi:hypothetical protein ACF0H5_006923 [Mactra antiquata]